MKTLSIALALAFTSFLPSSAAEGAAETAPPAEEGPLSAEEARALLPHRPDPPEALLACGLEAVTAEDWENALDLLEAAAAGAPDDLRFGAEYRQAVIAAEAYDRATDFFALLSQAHPESAAVALNEGFVSVDRIPVSGSVTQVILANTALEQFGRALEIEETWLGLYTRGNSYLYWPPVFDRTAFGIADLERAIELAEKLPPRKYHAYAWTALGDGHWRLGDVESARTTWQEGQERYPDWADLVTRLGLEGEALGTYLADHFATENRVATDLREIWAEEGDGPTGWGAPAEGSLDDAD